jgi:hypothetical protein
MNLVESEIGVDQMEAGIEVRRNRPVKILIAGEELCKCLIALSLGEMPLSVGHTLTPGRSSLPEDFGVTGE